MVGNYYLEFEPYNVEANLTIWVPPPFLVNALNAPYLTENVSTASGSSSLNLIFNHIYGIPSLFPNTDPLFLTETTPDNGTSLYYPSREITTLACRDQFRLQVEPRPGHNDGFVATGTFMEVN